MAKKTRAAALETRQHLLDAAEELFDRQGVAATSLQQIATQAGATRGAVYWHFKGKTELIDALFEDRVKLPLSRLADALLANHVDNPSPVEYVRRLLLGLAQGIADSVPIRRVLGIAVFKVERGVEGDLKRVMGQRRTQGVADMQVVIRNALDNASLAQAAHAEVAQAANGLMLIFDGLLIGWLMDLSDAEDNTLPVSALPERLRHIMDAYLRGLGLLKAD